MQYPSDFDIVLIAIIPSPEDLDIARLLGWYRIPLRFAPKVIRVDYLAFYQPSTFGKSHAARIEYFAEVKGVELATRGILFSDEPDHPRANEEYFKIQLGPLVHLEQPIKTGKWKRITFLYTTGEKFRTATIINDLVIKDEERKILWQSLRERAAQSDHYNKDQYTETSVEFDFADILDDLGNLLNHDDW